MEVIGGATAVLQLVVALSKTVQVASSAYHDIRRIDDRIEDFESQLEATRFHLNLLENCISSGTFGEHICRYAELVPVIKSCDRAYTRLSNIFVKIHRDRSWATSVRTATGVSSQSLADELNQRRIKHAEQMIASNQFSKAIPHLVRVLDGQPGSEKDPRLIRMLAKALGETDPNSKDAEILCKRYPSLALHLDAQRLVQAEILLAEPNLGGVVRLLQSYGVTQAEGFAYDDVNINIRLILSTALVQLSQADEALLILNRLSQREELDPAQTSDVHRLLAETYALKSDLDHAKSHCMQAIELNMEVRGRDDERTLACLSLMVDVCRKTMDPDEDIWKDMLPEGPERTVMASVSIGEISVSSSNPAQRLHALYRDMVEMAITDVGAAADLGTDFLRKNYYVDALSAKWYPNQPKKAGQVCFDCIRRNIIEMQILYQTNG
ncbi:hypothetical protein COL154_005718 [Colletotrichum chrysophilum]|uniref:uncharacterized protein n=1 Tax=Colletotrichum chrysophilum TaxID=1836956 RepID=UPI00230130E2|nr:uncharacterized protein COL26b_003862 [Colletotrichum chrysophilum]KAJ0345435.1 hypothetical protein KNSL1_008426 [Colletotrichum chrysophilum]KAJ0363099.1 hypothetical protein COL154_005718 [Colletotrichum chrysophilum]KAJ0377944.1 hypothetical protein COL26b_003862 [Colletotrichum chrysophilum]